LDSIFKWLEPLQNSNPILFLISVLLIVLLPKLFEYLTKAKRLEIENRTTEIDYLSKRFGVLSEKCETLERDIDFWKDKYYKMRESLADLEAENKILQMKLEDLRKRCNCGDEHVEQK